MDTSVFDTPGTDRKLSTRKYCLKDFALHRIRAERCGICHFTREAFGYLALSPFYHYSVRRRPLASHKRKTPSRPPLPTPAPRPGSLPSHFPPHASAAPRPSPPPSAPPRSGSRPTHLARRRPPLVFFRASLPAFAPSKPALSAPRPFSPARRPSPPVLAPPPWRPRFFSASRILMTNKRRRWLTTNRYYAIRTLEISASTNKRTTTTRMSTLN